MSSKRVCTSCIRALRRSSRLQQASSQPSLISSQGSLRQLSNSAPQWQEARSQTSSPTPAASQSEPSTAEMQRRIRSNLSSPSSTSPTSLAESLASKLRGTSTGSSYITYGVTEVLFQSCSAQAPYTIPQDQRHGLYRDDRKGPTKTAGGEDLGIPEQNTWWFSDLGLQPTFSTWSQVAYLHMWILTVRLRAMDNEKEFMNYQRYLLEHFSQRAEDKMLELHGMAARGIRNQYLKDLFMQWRGILAAYDEGLVKGDAVMASAVWRNLWKGAEDVDWEKVALVVGYTRCAIALLDKIPVDDIRLSLDSVAGVWAKSEKSAREVVQTTASRLRRTPE